jgi:hypothetical protein
MIRHSLLFGGEAYSLIGTSVIGRVHYGCPLEECSKNGFWRSPDIALWDNKRYVGKHHAKITLDRNSNCWIEDLRSRNGTAILRSPSPIRGERSPYYFERLLVGKEYKLFSGDIVTLAYNYRRGPYMMLTYNVA